MFCLDVKEKRIKSGKWILLEKGLNLNILDLHTNLKFSVTWSWFIMDKKGREPQGK